MTYWLLENFMVYFLEIFSREQKSRNWSFPLAFNPLTSPTSEVFLEYLGGLDGSLFYCNCMWGDSLML